MLKDVTTTLSDVQKELLTILTPRAILIGHSLNSDLKALKLTHPFLVDTGILYPHPNAPNGRHALKWLGTKYLRREIQKGLNGHDSVEDALACLDLVKQKCERGPKWGTGQNNIEPIFKRLGRVLRPQGNGATRSGAAVDWGDPSRGHASQAEIAIGCKTDDDVVKGLETVLKGEAVGKSGATSEVDFVWGRLRELELVRGWWGESKTDNVMEIRRAALERLGRPYFEGKDEEDTEATPAELGVAVARTVQHIAQVFESLPPCTAFIVYSGTGDPREVRDWQAKRRQWKEEYQTKNWDDLSVQWTDTETNALSQACHRALNGVGFVAVK
jgi:RNA exonuclease 1